MLGAVTLALGLAGGAVGYRSASVAQPPGTMTIGPATLATTDLQNQQSCSGVGCTFIQWSISSVDLGYASPVDGTIVAWRIASDSAGNKVKLRILRPAGGGKFSAVGSSNTETTTGSTTAPDQFSTNLPVKAGDIIGLDNANSALMFKTGVLGALPEFWTPPLADGSPASAPMQPPGTTSAGYQLQIDAFVQPAPKTTTPTTTTTTPTYDRDPHDHGPARPDLARASPRSPCAPRGTTAGSPHAFASRSRSRAPHTSSSRSGRRRAAGSGASGTTRRPAAGRSRRSASPTRRRRATTSCRWWQPPETRHQRAAFSRSRWKAPPQGIVDSAAISAAEGGPATRPS